MLSSATLKLLNNTTIGQGSFGNVLLGMLGDLKCAVKVIAIPDNLSCTRAVHEFECMKLVGDHPNICTPYGSCMLSDTNCFAIAMELCPGGDMFDLLQRYQNSIMPENAIRHYFWGLSHALVYMHNNNIIHCDIKLENIVLHDNVAKFVDFGLSNQVGCGSLSYVTPQWKSKVFPAHTDDVWALGVCVFACAFGFFPFEVADMCDWRFNLVQETQAKGGSSCGALCHTYKRECTISKRLQDMIDGILTIDMNMRWNGIQVLLCPWMTTPDERWSEEVEQFLNASTF